MTPLCDVSTAVFRIACDEAAQVSQTSRAPFLFHGLDKKQMTSKSLKDIQYRTIWICQHVAAP